MKEVLSKFSSWLFWGLIVFIVLYCGFGAIYEQVMLGKYEKVFAQAQHPQGTLLLDSLSFTFSFYPATYVDESIDFVPAYVIGQLRQYTGTWMDVETFYEMNKQLPDDKVVVAIPLEIQQRKQRTWLSVVDGFSIEPFDAQLVSELQYQYGSHGIPKNMSGSEKNLYLVYVVWVEYKDPRPSSAE